MPWEGKNYRLDIAEGKVSELEDVTIKNILCQLFSER